MDQLEAMKTMSDTVEIYAMQGEVSDLKESMVKRLEAMGLGETARRVRLKMALLETVLETTARTQDVAGANETLLYAGGRRAG